MVIFLNFKKFDFQEGVQDVKEVVKENLAHLPDGHR